MTFTREAHMIEPIQLLMYNVLQLDTIVKEFSAGYGIADLVGASLSKKSHEMRCGMGQMLPLSRHAVQVMFTLRHRSRTSIDYLANRVALSNSTLKRQVLPSLAALGLVERYSDGYVRRIRELPPPADRIVAVEAKQTRWRDAIMQARRYTFFADETYIAVWNGTARLVDRNLLYRHRLGLIGVDPDGAQVLVTAPTRKPRQPDMHRFCAEFLYGQALLDGVLKSTSCS